MPLPSIVRRLLNSATVSLSGERDKERPHRLSGVSGEKQKETFRLDDEKVSFACLQINNPATAEGANYSDHPGLQ